MLKEYASIFRRMMIFADLCLGIAAFYVAYFIRGSMGALFPLYIYVAVLPMFIVIWGGLLYFLGIYESLRTKQFSAIFISIWTSAILGIVFFGSLAYILKIQNISRLLIILMFFIAAIFTIIEKIAIILFIRNMRKKGYNFRNILIVGTGKRAQNFVDLVNKHSEWGFKIIGFLDMDASRKDQLIGGYKVLGTFNDAPSIVNDNVVDEIVFIVPHEWLDKLSEIMMFFKSEGLKIHVAVNYFELQFSKARQTELNGLPLLTFEITSHNLFHLMLKRFFDIVASGVGLILLSPLFLIISIIIKLTSKGPVFFRQTRSSLNGRKFTVYKFRTMIEGAEEKLKDLLVQNEMKGPAFKMQNDPRITKIGKILRKFSLDEYPQLWNVFVGDMSLVGPRPPLPTEVEKYEPWQRRRLSMRPGITCIWQIKGRNRIVDFNEWMKLDLEYIDNWSLWLDFKILFKTIPVVLFGIGAK